MAELDRNFAEIRREIKNSIEQLIENEMAGGNLDFLQEYIYGKRANVGRFSGGLPALWVIPAPHSPDTATMNQEEHPFKWVFAVLDRNNDHEEGRDEVEDESAKIYDVISGTENRQLSDTVEDSYPGQIMPAKEFQQNSETFWAAFEFIFLARRYRT